MKKEDGNFFSFLPCVSDDAGTIDGGCVASNNSTTTCDAKSGIRLTGFLKALKNPIIVLACVEYKTKRGGSDFGHQWALHPGWQSKKR